MKKAVLFFLVVSMAASLLADVDPQARWYKSNSVGLLLEEIDSSNVEEFKWTASEKLESNLSMVKRLYKNGVETKKWVTRYNREGRIIVDYEYDKGLPIAAYYYDQSGKVSEEHTFDPQGKLLERIVYVYESQTGRVSKSLYYTPNNVLVYYNNYDYTAAGQLRRIKRTDIEDTVLDSSAWTYISGKLLEEIHNNNDDSLIRRYELDGKLAQLQSYVSGRLDVSEDFKYNENGEVIGSSLVDSVDGSITKRDYNDAGQVIYEYAEKEGKLIREAEFTYTNDQLTYKIQRTGSLREEWYYEYRADDEMSQEIYYKSKKIFKKTEFISDEEKIEELYRDGKAFIRVYYKDEEKIKEEFLRNGRVIRTNYYQDEE